MAMKRPNVGRLLVATPMLILIALMLTGVSYAPQASGDASGNVQFWGKNRVEKNPTPTFVTNLPADPSVIQAGNSASYVIAAGKLYAWGDGKDGQLGVGDKNSEPTTAVQPTFPAGATIATVGEGGAWAAAADTSGQGVWGWGANRSGVLCHPRGGPLTTPTAITNLLDSSGVKEISGGYEHSEFLFHDGSVESCGVNNNAELGDGSTKNSAIPVRVEFPKRTDIVSISSGNEFTIALDSNGHLWCWGYSPWGQCGVVTRRVEAPIKISLPATVIWYYAGGSGAKNGHVLALLSNGNLYAWGSNAYGQLGNGKRDKSNPKPLQIHVPGATIVSVAAGGTSSFAVDSSGNLWVWGSNTAGRLGDPSLPRVVLTPTQLTKVSGLHDVSATAGTAVVY
jgi:alpha-tubulin suppressor-like RCC1 family protein